MFFILDNEKAYFNEKNEIKNNYYPTQAPKPKQYLHFYEYTCSF